MCFLFRKKLNLSHLNRNILNIFCVLIYANILTLIFHNLFMISCAFQVPQHVYLYYMPTAANYFSFEQIFFFIKSRKLKVECNALKACQFDELINVGVIFIFRTNGHKMFVVTFSRTYKISSTTNLH